MGNRFKHFKVICKHKYWVAHYCFMCSEYRRGLKHDMSKFSHIEFSEGAFFYSENESPIKKAKQTKGYSEAWLHHKGKNDHHYQYWVDDFDHGGKPIRMPYACTVEMVCDYLGAAKTYLGKDFTYHKELEWWEEKSHPENHILMHEDTVLFVSIIMTTLAELEDKYRKYVSGDENTVLSDSWVGKRILNKEILSDLYIAITKHNEKQLERLATKMSRIK